MTHDTDANQTRFDPDAEAQGRKCDHAEATNTAKKSPYSSDAALMNNLAACYLDLTARHKKLLELAEKYLYAAIGTAEFRAFIEEERKRTWATAKSAEAQTVILLGMFATGLFIVHHQ